MYRLPRSLTLRHQSPTIRRRRTAQPTLPRTQQRWKSSILYKPLGEPVRYQAVRFKRPRLTMRRIVMSGLYVGVVYAYLNLLLRQLDVEIEFVEGEEEQAEARNQEQEGEEEEEEVGIEGPLYADPDSTFIPLTWSTPLPRSFYRGSDPEWQTFIQIAKDQPRHKRIQDDLVQIVYAGCTQHPSISRQLGKDLKIGKYWLDISFPDGPPQEYERRGIEIGDGYVAWSTQKVDAEKQWRTERALVPRAAAEGVWRTGKVLAGIQWRRMKQYLGWEEADPGSPEERYKLALEMAQQQQNSKDGRPQTDPTAALASTSARSTAASSPTTQAGSQKKGEIPYRIPTIPLPSTSSNPLTSDLPIAMHVFSATLSKSWNPKKPDPPRGSFVVQGLVEVRGSKGRMLFDVQSCYDPRGGKFVNVNAGVRGYKRWKQSPRGGP